MDVNKEIDDACKQGNLNQFTIFQLKFHLRSRGQYVSGKKCELIERVKGAYGLGLKDINIVREEGDKERFRRENDKLKTPLGEQYHHPSKIECWTDDVHLIPDLTEKDIYNYFVYTIQTKRQLKAKVMYEDRHVHKIQEKNYFQVPCMLRQATPKEIISPESHPEEQSTSILCFLSTDKFLPPPLFHRLIGACLTHWPIAKQKSENLIYCGCCVFDLDLHHRLTLYFRNYVIFAQVTGSGVTDTNRSSERCREARKFICKNLSELIGNAGNSLQLHVQCPDSEADSLESLIAVSHLKMHEKVPCRSHKKSHILVSQPLLKFWYKEKKKLHQKVLNRCLPKLVRNLDLSTVSDYIIQEECFDNVIMQDIKDQKTTSDQIRELIKRIQQRGYNIYEKFKVCLVLAKQENLKAILDNMEAELASRVKGKDEAQATEIGRSASEAGGCALDIQPSHTKDVQKWH